MNKELKVAVNILADECCPLEKYDGHWDETMYGKKPKWCIGIMGCNQADCNIIGSEYCWERFIRFTAKKS